MKVFPSVVFVTVAALLIGCGHPTAGPSEADKEAKERLAEEQLAQQQSQLHEQQAALDERERELSQKELTVVSTPVPEAPAPPQEQAPPPPPPEPEAAPAPVASAPNGMPNASLQEFYDALSPYGSWLQMAPYGYVWQPNATLQDQNWRPYTEGHWVDTDDGWTWVSDEPFGWATYHYGRWMRTHEQGWVWVPGDQWAPAWVSWRYGNDFVGWAPLPPEATLSAGPGIQQFADQQYGLAADDYTFVPAAEFGDDNMAPVEVPFNQEGPIYDESNNITDMYYGDGGYTILCYGPNYEFMRSKSHRHLHDPYKLKRDGYRDHGNNGAVVAGNTLQVSAPRIVGAGRPTAPKLVHSTIFDARVVSIPKATPAHGSGIAPLYRPPTTTLSAAQSAAARYQAVPIPSSNLPVQATVPVRGAPGSAPGRVASVTQALPPPVLAPHQSAANAEQMRDQQIIEQEQAQRALEKQQQEALNARAEQAAEAHANAERTQQVEHAQQQAVRQQQAAAAAVRTNAEAVRQQTYRSVQPMSVPVGTQQGTGTGTGRNQQ